MPNQVSSQVIRAIKAGQEDAYEHSLREFFQKALPIPGQLSVHVVRPVSGREWGILRTFESDKRLEHISGLETWFTLPGAQAIIPPPRLVMPNLARLLKGWLYHSEPRLDKAAASTAPDPPV